MLEVVVDTNLKDAKVVDAPLIMNVVAIATIIKTMTIAITIVKNHVSVRRALTTCATSNQW